MKKLFFALCMMSPLLLQAATMGPDELVKQTSEKVLSTLEKNKALYDKEPDRIYQLVDDIILPHLDFVAMSKLALGKNWNQATPDQQTRFTEAFKSMLIRTYSKSLTEYAGQKIEYLPYRPADASKMTTEVSSRILQANGPAIPIDYRLRFKDDAWKVFDITIDGISLVTNYRNSFAGDIRAVGMDGLIDKLNAKLADKAGDQPETAAKPAKSSS
ncbi:MAG TPA: ABC transporter substrate-binding protein [Gammaproteobacteria bacterium]|nr:ABC transporter substrate-binding protein [Gammaproteobacteria bacterium]